LSLFNLLLIYLIMQGTMQSQPQAPSIPQDILDEDDDFEEFEVEDWGIEQEEQQRTSNGTVTIVEDVKLWEDNWDDDEEDDFSVQLRAELNKVSQGKITL
jgi:hypothetical protein